MHQSKNIQEQQIYKTHDIYLNGQAQEVKLLNESKEGNLKELLLHFSRRLKHVGIPYLIHLHHYKLLSDAIKLGLQQLDKGKVYQQFKVLHILIEHVFPKFLKNISDCHKEYTDLLNNEKYQKLNVNTQSVIKSVQKQMFIKWEKLINEYLQIKSMHIFNIHEFNKFINDRLLNFEISEQVEDTVCMNWLKEKLQTLRNNQKNICCRLIFYQKMVIKAIEDKNTEFKKYFWPISSANIEFHLRKTIVGFLNTGGGIIYIGIQQNKQKSTAVSGIQLKKNQLGSVYGFFNKLVDCNIFPKHKGFQISTDKSHDIVQGKKIEINQYINIEFMPVVKQQNLLPIQNKYIVKIFVKIGHPKHLYHLINTDNMIDFFVRDDRNVEKRAFPESYKSIYEKLTKFQKYKEENRDKEPEQPKNQANLQKRETFHNDCRYVMTGITIDIDNDDSDESD